MIEKVTTAQKVMDDRKKAIEENIRWRVTPPFYGYGFKIIEDIRLIANTAIFTA